MKTFISSLKLTAILLIILSGIYPFLVMAIGKLVKDEGKGITIESKGEVVGYENIGQTFSSAQYFWGRPSAVNYNAAGSGGSNKGPYNPDYLAVVQSRIDTFIARHPGIKRKEIPVDIITASGSGLDPHISVEAARIQVKRVARARNIDEADLLQLIDHQTEKPLLGLFGPACINVLKLNIALDQLITKK